MTGGRPPRLLACLSLVIREMVVVCCGIFQKDAKLSYIAVSKWLLWTDRGSQFEYSLPNHVWL